MTKTKAKNNSGARWKESEASVFWGEIAPCNHLLQIYESDDVVLASLEGFVVSGFEINESVVIIATEAHLQALNTRLIEHGYNVTELQKNNLYLPFNAEDMLAKFMVNNWPDEHLFNAAVTSVVKLARNDKNRNVRAYGEMVAILWAKGLNGATVQLEFLWNKFCSKESFCLFCAYPKSGFTQNIEASIDHICSAHTKIISGDHRSTSQVFYRESL
jgi:hypothetical protein